MKPEEIRAAGSLATAMLADSVSHLEQAHRAVAGRVFSLSHPASRPVRSVHDVVTTGIYGLLRGTTRVAGVAATEVVGVMGGSVLTAGSTSSGNLALAALNAALGDELAEEGSPLAIPMAVRQARSDIALRLDALGVAFPQARSKLAVFLHGLGETEESWRLHADRQDRDEEATYGSRLDQDLGFTPVYVRYNTGLHISENGRCLAALLDELVAAWPAPVAELVLVGHSMGGLVARSACHQAWARGDSWVSSVSHVFYLGCPHLGAGLERWVSNLSDLLATIDVGRPLASALNRRSAGIKDLGTGSLLDDDWRQRGEGPKTAVRDVPLLPWANHYAISATVTARRRNPLGRVLGDLLVQPGSARGRARHGRGVAFPDEHKRNFERLHHFNLLNHPSVYEAMRSWLDPLSCARTEAVGGPAGE